LQVIIPPLWDWNTEQERGTDRLTVILSAHSWIGLYTAESTTSDQPEGDALQQQAEEAWSNFTQAHHGLELSGGPTFAGVVRIAGDADHFVLVRMDLHTGFIDVSDYAKARLAG